MKEQLILFKTAKLAKEKGFDIPCQFAYQSIRGNKPFIIGNRYKNNLPGNLYYILKELPYNILYKEGDDDECWSAPTQSLLQKWLIEKYDIYVVVCPFNPKKKEFEVIIYFKKDKSSNEYIDITQIIYNTTWGDTLEIGLYDALKLIKDE